MITFEDVSIRYSPGSEPVLSQVNLTISEGELAVVVGPTGCGKSTFLKSINGLVPHFTGGIVSGQIRVNGRSTADHHPRDLAETVGIVLQDPMSGFVADTVEDELAYSMECLAIPPDVMRRRVEETLDLLGLHEARNRPLVNLSAGQKQRVAIGAALAAHPRVLVLDEPTSALDPTAAEEVLAALHRLVHDLAITVVIAEHRLERVLQYADVIVTIPGGGQPVTLEEPREAMAHSVIAPAAVRLAREMHWSPLPMTVREARRQATHLRSEEFVSAPRETTRSEAVSIDVQRVSAGYGRRIAVKDVSLRFHEGEITALMGRNGAGKTTLLHSLIGLVAPVSGSIRVRGKDPHGWSPKELISNVGYVPANPRDVLEFTTVSRECETADELARLPQGTTSNLLCGWAPGIDPASHPADLSEGQRLLLVLALVMAAQPPILILDEPTRGLDYPTKEVLIGHLQTLAQGGTTIVIATHDVELAAELADRVVVLAQGEVVTDGPTRDVVTSSPMFAPQIAKIMAPLSCITIADVHRVGAI